MATTGPDGYATGRGDKYTNWNREKQQEKVAAAAAKKNMYTDWNRAKQEEKQNINHTVPEATKVYSGGSSGGGGGSSASNGYSEYLDALRSMQEELRRQQEEARAEKDRQVNAAYAQGKQNLGAAHEQSLRDAYVAYMQGMKNNPQIAAVGGNGGRAESLATKQRINYEDNRSALEQNYLDNLADLENNRAAGIISNTQDYLAGMSGVVKQEMPSISSAQAALATAAGGTASGGGSTWTGKYKVGNQTVSQDELIDRLYMLGMTSDQIAAYMKQRGLDY